VARLSRLWLLFPGSFRKKIYWLSLTTRLSKWAAFVLGPGGHQGATTAYDPLLPELVGGVEVWGIEGMETAMNSFNR